MDSAAFFFLLLLSNIYLVTSVTDSSQESDCNNSKQCSNNGPIIQFPFRLKTQPKVCGYPGFELSCRGNETVLEFPFSREFFVSYINYYEGTLSVSYPDGCLPRRLLDLNLSSSPFNVYNNTLGYNYKFLNCTTNVSSISTTYNSVPCLSSPSGYIYAVPTIFPLGLLSHSSCRSLPDSIPIQGYLTNDFYRLELEWQVPNCTSCYLDAGHCRLNKMTNRTECIGYPPSNSMALTNTSKGSKAIIGASVCVFIALVSTVAAVFIYKSKAHKKKGDQTKIANFLEEYKSMKPKRYSYAEINKMTKHFKNELGQGGYGKVFKGRLPNRLPVAVKVLEISQSEGKEFINEVGTLGRVHHFNVIRLLGFCVEGSKRALIYEFMTNESLEKLIFSKDNKNPLLCWNKLKDIAIGVARGLEYLHTGCDQCILHFDIKPHNILLDHNFNPKISDFGLAKLCVKGKSIVSMTAARGTLGYIAPEVFSKKFGAISYKVDVYSFGMLLLEMVGGRKNTDFCVDRSSQVYFPEWVYNCLEQGIDLGLVMTRAEDNDTVKKLTITALWCVQWNPTDRPSMKVVLQMLEGSMESLSLPPNPFTSYSEMENIDLFKTRIYL